VDDRRARLDLVRAEHDENAVDGALPHALEYRLEQQFLLRRSEPG
jgi:hypothetical protein